jgi:hypothetical protein
LLLNTDARTSRAAIEESAQYMADCQATPETDPFTTRESDPPYWLMLNG